jgi:hypothetical protein
MAAMAVPCRVSKEFQALEKSEPLLQATERDPISLGF